MFFFHLKPWRLTAWSRDLFTPEKCTFTNWMTRFGIFTFCKLTIHNHMYKKYDKMMFEYYLLFFKNY